jgi:segregation and condensation protein A
MNDEPYIVKLSDVFEGPMDLLVHLIKKSEVDIHDIPIALITDQFLEYIEWIKAMDIDLAGDFLVMAATLAQIKSKMLLPVHEKEDEEDPREALTEQLLEYLKMKSAAEQLSERNLLGDQTFIRTTKKDDLAPAPDEQMIQVGLFELIDAFQRILKNVSPDHRIDLTADRISVKDKMTEIVNILEAKGSLTFEELFEGQKQRSDIIVTFLAVLEMVKLYLVSIAQHAQTGVIRLFYI